MKILITAFEPFGIIGKLLNRNSSEKMLKKLMREYPELHYIILPVNKESRQILDLALLGVKPDVVIGLGEGISKGIRIECWAYDGGKTFHSEFAAKLKKGIKGVEIEENIGNYYCNYIYSHLLKIHKNSVFIHVPFFQKNLDFLLIKKIIDKLKNES